MTHRETLKTALHILLSGRSLDADTAKDIGLVDELADSDALIRATELARAFITGENGQVLKTAFEHRQAAVQAWESPTQFPEEILRDEEIQTLINALKHSDRKSVV